MGIEPMTFHMRSENHTPRPNARGSQGHYFQIYTNLRIVCAETHQMIRTSPVDVCSEIFYSESIQRYETFLNPRNQFSRPPNFKP